MGDRLNLDMLWQNATPETRRSVLKKIAGGAIAAPVLAGLLTAPGAQASPVAKSGASPRSSQGEPVSGGITVWTAHQEIASLSPDDTGPTMQFFMIGQIHDALVWMDYNYELQPSLADSWTISEDGLTYTFMLHSGVMFHNGAPFTSADVKYTYEFYGSPDNATVSSVDFEAISSIDTPDDLTVVITLSVPNPAFLAKIGTFFIVPHEYHAEIGEEAYKGKPIGTGAFKLKEWRPAEYTLVERNDGYFKGTPYLDEVRMDIVPEASVRAISLETGESDISAWPLVTEDSLRLAEDPKFRFYKTASLAVNHFPLNNSLPALSDKRVRQAMMFAIDRQKVIDDIFSGTATVASANLSPALAGFYNGDVALYPYDTAKAAALLDEAGWTLGSDGVREMGGEKLAFTCTTITGDQARRPEAEVVQQYLAAVGIDMQLEEAPVSSILEGLRAGEMDCSLFNWTYGGDNADPDATQTLGTGGSNNFSQYSNARVDELLAAGLTETDADARKAIYVEIQAIIADEVPFLYMMFWDWYAIINTRLQGLPETVLTSDPVFLTAYKWWIQE